MARNEGMLMVDALIEAKKRIAELEAEVAELRRHLFLWHDCEARVKPSGELSLSARKATPKTEASE